MRSPYALLAASLAIFCHLPALAQPDLCFGRRNRLEAWLQTLKPLTDLSRESKIKDADVVFLGENHDTNVQLEYPALIAALRKANPRLDCLYLEDHVGKLPVLDKLARGESVSAREPLRQYAHLLHLGLKVHMVDNHWTRAPDVNVDRALAWLMANPNLDEIEYRNAVIAPAITDTLNSGACRGGIMIAGFKHVIGAGSLKSAVVKLGSKAASIMTFDTGAAGRSANSLTAIDPRWEMELPYCRLPMPEAKVTGYAPTERLEGLPLLMIFDRAIGAWTDFDFAFTGGRSRP